MAKPFLAFVVLVVLGWLGGCRTADANGSTAVAVAAAPAVADGGLGAFSVSLAVKDLAASRAFYEKLGFTGFAGDPKQNWLILRNGATTIGLFQGLFPSNIMTFNPGWSQDAKPLATFRDVRQIQADWKAKGIAFMAEADPASAGPAHCMLADPDGNVILLDQHVPSPGKEAAK
jgi:catechol 2,3-dioxygenase-like lactoylglutathione lyase family enzyme